VCVCVICAQVEVNRICVRASPLGKQRKCAQLRWTGRPLLTCRLLFLLLLLLLLLLRPLMLLL